MVLNRYCFMLLLCFACLFVCLFVSLLACLTARLFYAATRDRGVFCTRERYS